MLRGVLRLHQEPRSEAAEVAVGDAAAVVELEHRPLVRRRRVPEATGHPQMNHEDLTASEPEQQVFPSALD